MSHSQRDAAVLKAGELVAVLREERHAEAGKAHQQGGAANQEDEHYGDPLPHGQNERVVRGQVLQVLDDLQPRQHARNACAGRSFRGFGVSGVQRFKGFGFHGIVGAQVRGCSRMRI
jgi:hypothetical protein